MVPKVIIMIKSESKEGDRLINKQLYRCILFGIWRYLGSIWDNTFGFGGINMETKVSFYGNVT